MHCQNSQYLNEKKSIYVVAKLLNIIQVHRSKIVSLGGVGIHAIDR